MHALISLKHREACKQGCEAGLMHGSFGHWRFASGHMDAAEIHCHLPSDHMIPQRKHEAKARINKQL